MKGASPIESYLHLCLKEHLNAEIVLETIKDVSMAVSWLRTTFLYVRAMKHPNKYGIKINSSIDQLQLRSKVEQYLFGKHTHCTRITEQKALGSIFVFPSCQIFAFASWMPWINWGSSLWKIWTSSQQKRASWWHAIILPSIPCLFFPRYQNMQLNSPAPLHGTSRVYLLIPNCRLK